MALTATSSPHVHASSTTAIRTPASSSIGFGEGYGDCRQRTAIFRRYATTGKSSVPPPSRATVMVWTGLHKLYAEKLIDPECFTQEWSTYVSKGKAGRYGVCFSWDVANIRQPDRLGAAACPDRRIPGISLPQNGSFTSGFARGRCVVTAKATNPALVCAWLDLDVRPPPVSAEQLGYLRSMRKALNIFELSTNDKGEPMLKHARSGRCFSRGSP